MKKKIIGIFIVMLLFSSAMTTMILSEKGSVEASEEPQDPGMNLDYDWVWNRTKDFGNVIYNAYDPEDIKKGREWATAGEEYTIVHILRDAMNGFDNPCGLSEYAELPIGYLEDSWEPGWETLDIHKPKQYSSKIDITDYSLTIHKDGENPEEIDTSELFPLGVGNLNLRWWPTEADLDRTFEIDNANIEWIDIQNLINIGDYKTVPCTLLNEYDTFVGPVVYLDTLDPVPENHDCIFILNEESASEEKLNALSDANGCILIEDSSKGYTFENSSYYNFSIVKLDGMDNNFSSVIEDIQSGSIYVADNIQDGETIMFTNCSNQPCCSGPNYVVIFSLDKETDFGTFAFFKNLFVASYCPKCQGAIMVNYAANHDENQEHPHPYGDTHMMAHTVRNWSWFAKGSWFEHIPGNHIPGPYFNRFPLPIFSVSHNLGWKLIEDLSSYHIDYGHLTQVYRKQTEETPGVTSHNVVAYRNISQSPQDTAVVLSHRMDGWWGECPGDASTSGAILLGIAKYMKDNEITPKYNLTFLFTTGEEYGMRGAQYYVDSHPKNEYNYKYWIGFEQLGFNYPPGGYFRLSLSSYNDDMKSVLKEIERQTNYEERILNKYEYETIIKKEGSFSGAEDWVWKDICDTILIEKGNGVDRWDGHHQVGDGYQQGDSLQYIDQDDVDLTFELAWNMTKYYVVNPDCQFDGTVTYSRTDSPNDEDEELDTIEATIPIKSILPQDKIRVKAVLKNLLGVQVASATRDYIISNSTSNFTINVTLPPGRLPGLYKLWLYLYNSTGRINQILSISPNDPNDTTNSDFLFLYPRGNQAPTTPTQPIGPTSLKRGELGSWSALTSDPNNDLVGQKWYMYYDTWPYTPQYDTGLYDPESLTLLLMHRYWTTGTHQIRVKAYDEYSTLLHPYESELSPYLTVEVTPWCDIIEQQQTHQEGLLHVVEGLPFQFYGELSGGENHVFEWNFNDHTRCSTMQNPEHTYSDSGMYNVTFNVTDETTQLIGRTYVHVRVSDLDSNFNMNYYHGAAPETIITFWNTSKAKTGNHITNVTWDFDDGTISYANIVNHTFETDGDYNVTLTVKDSANNTDVDYAILHISSNPEPPEIPYVQSPGVLPPDSEATILAEIIPTDRNLSSVTVNITTPNGIMGNYTMTEIIENIYIYTLDNTSQNGQFNFTIWATDIENNTNSSTGNFTMVVPLLSFETPTPSNYAIRNHNWVNVNVTVLDPLNTSAFIDWNRSLRGYWSMDAYNTTGVNDNSTYENFGTFENSMNSSNIKTGKYGKALEFDGIDDYVDFGTNSSLDLGTGDFTFMVWEKSHNPFYLKKAMILSNSPACEDWKGYGFGVANTAYLFVSQSSGRNVTVEGTIDVTDNTWHHIAYVRDGGEYSIYVDGVFDTQGLVIHDYNITNSQSTNLGYNGRTSNWCYFDGMLDEPQLYNQALSREEINASYNNGLYDLYRNFTGLTDGTYSYSAHAIDISGNMSETETRTVTIDLDPLITNVNASPHTVGFGYNVTISANITDPGSGVNTVNVNVTYPDQSHGNFTMSHATGNTYQYIFTDTWLTGQYNYTIWATDNSNNSNSSSEHHFHVSVTATISIATLKDSYSGTQYINITDPPNPPENLTVIDRGLTWNTYYNASSGENILETYQGPVNFLEDNGTWTPINNTFYLLASNHPAYVYGYRSGNDHGLYGVYFKSNAQLEWPVAFTYNRSDDPTIHAVRSKLVGVGYVDPQSNWVYQYLQNVQSSEGQTNGYSITYPGVFTGTDVTWSYGNTGLKEEITLSNATKTVLQNHPPSQYGLNDTSSYLVFITKLDYQNLNLYNGSGLLDGNVTISDAGVDFKDVLGQFKCALPLGEAYELNNESLRQKLTYRIVHLNGNTYLLSGLKVSDLNAMAFPVVIDPTLSVYSLTNDGYIYNSSSNYNTAWTASTGTISSSATYLSIGQSKVASFPADYRVYRSFLPFNTSSLPSNAFIDKATLSVYKKDDYSTTDFTITIQNGQPTYPHNPLQASDYAKSHYSGNGGSLNTINFVNGRNNITLTDLTWINTTGITKLCLRSSRDINGNTPTGSEYVNVYSANAMDPNPDTSYKPKLIIAYRNQSKIKNTGSTNINGYLLIQVQFYNSTQGKWLLDDDTINETTPRTITSGTQLALDTIFNGHVRASDLTHGTGTYRVYATFRDSDGNILKTNDGAELKAWWQFSKT